MFMPTYLNVGLKFNAYVFSLPFCFLGRKKKRIYFDVSSFAETQRVQKKDKSLYILGAAITVENGDLILLTH